MRRSLTQLVTAASLFVVASAPAAYAAPSDYSECEAGIKYILRKVRIQERTTNYEIGSTMVINFIPLSVDQEICILKGLELQAGNEYGIISHPYPDRTDFEFVRIKRRTIL